jgi:hypothetical protein
MNLSEIITEMESHPNTISVTQEDHTDHVFCNVVYDLGDDIARTQTINVIVKDRGLGGETAYYETHRPKHMQSDSAFKIDLEARIAVIMGAQAEFKFYKINGLDSNEDRAFVDTYWEDTGNLVLKQYGAWRKADESIDFMEII